MKRIGWIVLVALVLAACGNKGPLTLPDMDKADQAQKDKRELKQ